MLVLVQSLFQGLDGFANVGAATNTRDRNVGRDEVLLQSVYINTRLEYERSHIMNNNSDPI